jgi:hypothetical protein
MLVDLKYQNRSCLSMSLKGRLHGAFLMCVSMSDKPFDAEVCNIGGRASATNGLSDMKTHIENAPCNRPLKANICRSIPLNTWNNMIIWQHINKK